MVPRIHGSLLPVDCALRLVSGFCLCANFLAGEGAPIALHSEGTSYQHTKASMLNTVTNDRKVFEWFFPHDSTRRPHLLIVPSALLILNRAPHTCQRATCLGMPSVTMARHESDHLQIASTESQQLLTGKRAVLLRHHGH
jgi:hypothetical protein